MDSLGTRHDHHRGRADEQHGVAQRERDADPKGGFHLGGVGGKARGDLAALHLVEERRVERGQVAEHGGADICDNALAQGDHEIEAQRACQREHGYDQQEHAEIGVDHAAARLGEAEIDDPTHGDWTTSVAADATASAAMAAAIRPL
jgi:hypothetical protein